MKRNSPLKLWYQEPAGQEWTRALPIGCGKLGAMVFGNIVSERIQLNEDSLWNGGPRDRNNPSTREALPVIRQLLQAGRLAEAHALVNDAMAGIPDSMRCYEPLADLLVEFEHPGVPLSSSAGTARFDESQVGNYRRELDLETATVRVQYETHGHRYEREHIASAVENCIIIRYTAHTPGTLSLRLRLERGPRDSYSSRYADSSRGVEDHGVLIKGAAGGEQGVRFVCGLRSRVEGGRVRVIGETLKVEGADTVTLVLTAATSFREADPEAYVLQRSAEALQRDWSQLCAEHRKDYASLFDRVALELGTSAEVAAAALLPTDQRLLRQRQGQMDPDLAALYFNFGRYLLIASSRPGSLPANLQGVWNTDFQPSWGSKYTININLEMNYWAAEAANLPECHEPLFDLIGRVAENGRRTAEVMYGCRGFVAHHNTDIWADTCPTDRNLVASYWPMGGGWLALHLWQHYAYGHDLEFLRKAWPVLREASRFYLDFLVENEKGQLIIVPGCSPENSYRLPNGEVGVLSAGCAMDSSILEMLFRFTGEAARILNCESDLVKELEQARARLPRPAIGKNGRLLEWMEEYEEIDLQHRHVSHGFAAHPGDQISPRRTPELAVAFKNTLRSRGDEGTGWCMAWKSCFWARMGDGDKAHQLLLNLLQPVENDPTIDKNNTFLGGGSYPNLFCAHPPFQIDGNFGGTAAILEMLLQSHETKDGWPILHILPALPSAWSEGRVSGLRAQGGFTLSFSWKLGVLDGVEIRATTGGACLLEYQQYSRQLELTQGQSLTLSGDLK